jgi:surface polysaccharide O-acyltransferase-like enzyme
VADLDEIRWITALRALATIGVVQIHVAAAAVVLERPIGSTAWWVGNLVDAASRWCVPVFVLISGALLLDAAKESPATFYRRRARRLLVPILFWTVFYFALQSFLGKPMTTGWVLERLAAGRPYYHLWYLYMVIGLYGATPLLRWWVARTTSSHRWTVTITLFAFASAYNVGAMLGSVPAANNILTLPLPYIGYYIGGYQLRRSLQDVSRGIWSGLFTVAFATIAIGTRFLLERRGIPVGLYLYEYLSPPVILLSISLFMFVRSAGEAGRTGSLLTRATGSVARASLGIYAIHPAVHLGLQRSGLDYGAAGPLFGVPVQGVATVLISWFLVEFLARIPLLRHSVAR